MHGLLRPRAALTAHALKGQRWGQSGGTETTAWVPVSRHGEGPLRPGLCRVGGLGASAQRGRTQEEGQALRREHSEELPAAAHGSRTPAPEPSPPAGGTLSRARGTLTHVRATDCPTPPAPRNVKTLERPSTHFENHRLRRRRKASSL